MFLALLYKSNKFLFDKSLTINSTVVTYAKTELDKTLYEKTNRINKILENEKILKINHQ